MQYTLRQLEIFLAIAKAQSISQAAASLCMSQSAASAALAQLESHCAVTLFERSGKRLRLGKSGAAIQTQAQTLLDHAQRFERSLREIDDTGHLHVGASLTIGNYLAVNYFSQFIGRYPDVDTSFQIGNSPEILAKVLNFEIDIGLVESETQHSDLQLLRWRKDRLVVFCSPEHPLANKGVMRADDIKSVRWILREANSGTRQTFDRAMQGILPEMHVFLEIEHNEAIKRAVEANIGIGCLSETAVAANFKSGSLVPLQTPGRALQRYFYFALHRQRDISSTVKQWMSLCRKADPVS
jgi:DNA-binding transcriptional LysR family regulator